MDLNKNGKDDLEEIKELVKKADRKQLIIGGVILAVVVLAIIL